MFCIVFQQLFGSTVTYALSEWPYWVLCSAVIWKCSDSCAECTNIFCVVFQPSVLVLPAWPTMTCAVCENIQCASAVTESADMSDSDLCTRCVNTLSVVFQQKVGGAESDLRAKCMTRSVTVLRFSQMTCTQNQWAQCYHSLLVAQTVAYVLCIQTSVNTVSTVCW